MATTDNNPAGIIASPPSLYLGATAIALLLQFVVPLAIVHAAGYLRLAGLMLLLAGAGLARWSFRVMHGGGASASPYTASAALVTAGPFKYSRNPVYLAMTGLYLGLALLVNSLWLPILLIPLLLVMQFGVVLREEAYLLAQFGEAYRRYRSQVRRWL